MNNSSEKKPGTRERVHTILSEAGDVVKRVIDIKIADPHLKFYFSKKLDAMLFADALAMEFNRQRELNRANPFGYAFTKVAIEYGLAQVPYMGEIFFLASVDAIFEAFSPEAYNHFHTKTDNWYQEKCRQEYALIDSPERKPDESLSVWHGRLIGDDQNFGSHHDIYGIINLGAFTREMNEAFSEGVADYIFGEFNPTSKQADAPDTSRHIQFSIDSKGRTSAGTIDNVMQLFERLTPKKGYAGDAIFNSLFSLQQEVTNSQNTLSNSEGEFPFILQPYEYSDTSTNPINAIIGELGKIQLSSSHSQGIQAQDREYSGQTGASNPANAGESNATRANYGWVYEQDYTGQHHEVGKFMPAILKQKTDDYTPGVKISPFLSINPDGSWCIGLAAAVKFEAIKDISLLPLLKLAPITIPVAAIVGLGFYINQQHKQAKQEYHFDIVKTQINALSMEVNELQTKVLHYARLSEQYFQDSKIEAGGALFKKLQACREEVESLVSKLSQKYDHLVTADGVKLTVRWIDPIYYILKATYKDLKYTDNPRLSPQQNNKLRKAFNEEMQEMGKLPPFYKFDRHKPTKETIKYINNILPALSELSIQIQADKELMFNEFLNHYNEEENRINQQLCELTQKFLEGLLSNDKFNLQAKELMHELKFWKKEANELLNKWDLTLEQQQSLISIKDAFKSKKESIHSLSELIKKENDFSAQFNQLSDQFKQGLINKDTFKAAVHNIEEKSINNDSLSTLIETVINENLVSQYNQHSESYKKKEEKLSALVDEVECDNERVAALSLELGDMTKVMIAILSEINANSSDNSYKEIVSSRIKNLVHDNTIWLAAKDTSKANIATIKFRDKVNACRQEYEGLNERKNNIFTRFENEEINEEEFYQNLCDLENDSQNFSAYVEEVITYNLSSEELKTEFKTRSSNLRNYHDECIMIILNKKINELNVISSKNSDPTPVSKLILEIIKHWELLRNKSNSFTIFDSVLNYSSNDGQTAQTLDLIEKHRSNFTCEREKNIINIHVAIAKTDKVLLAEAFTTAKALPSNEEKAFYMRKCLLHMEKIDKTQRNVEQKMALSSATKLLNIRMWLDLLNVNLKIQEQLQKEYEDLGNLNNNKQTNSDEKHVKEQQLNVIKKVTEELYAIAKDRIHYEKNAHLMFDVYIANYANCAIDFAQLFDDYLANKFGWSVEFVRSFMTTSSLLCAVSSRLLEYAFQDVSVDETIERMSDLTESQEKILRHSLVDLSSKNYKYYIDKFFSYSSTGALLVRFFLSFADSRNRVTYENLLFHALKYFNQDELNILKELTNKLKEEERASHSPLIAKIEGLNYGDFLYKEKTFNAHEIRFIRLILLSGKNIELSRKLMVVTYEDWVDGIHVFSKFETKHFIEIKELITEDRKKGLNEKSPLLGRIFNLREENDEYKRASFSQQDAQYIDAFLQEKKCQSLAEIILKENTHFRLTTRNAAQITQMLDRASQLQFLHQLHNFLNPNWDNLCIKLEHTRGLLSHDWEDQCSKVLELSKTLVSCPGLSSYINFLFQTPGEQASTNWYAVFAISFLENLHGKGMLGVAAKHDTTIVHFMASLIQMAGYTENADILFSLSTRVRMALFLSRVVLAFQAAIYETNDIVLAGYINNLLYKFENQFDALSKGEVDERSLSFKVIMTQVCRDLISIIRHRPEMKMRSLYYRALFLQHYFEETISTPVSQFGNKFGGGLFEAVSHYTDETAEQLKQIAGIENIDKIMQVIGRPIIVIYGSRESIQSKSLLMDSFNLGAKGLGDFDCGFNGNPIFVLFDEREKQYHGLTLNTEIYSFSYLSQKLEIFDHSAPVPLPLSLGRNRIYSDAERRKKLTNKEAKTIIKNLQSAGFSLPKNAAAYGLVLNPKSFLENPSSGDGKTLLQSSISPVNQSINEPPNKNKHAIEQLGWNCFDIALGMENITRAQIVKYALDQSSDINVRKLLAPEIKHAAALTVAYKNELISNPELPPNANLLPEVMYTETMKNLYNQYYSVYHTTKARDVFAKCNNAIDHLEGNRLSWAELELFFKQEKNRNLFPKGHQLFLQIYPYFTEAEELLNKYCCQIDVYELYVNEYYGKNQWFAFNAAMTGERSTGMIDITAKMLSARIFISLPDGKVYKTDTYGPRVIHIDYNGVNHFTASIPVMAAPLGSDKKSDDNDINPLEIQKNQITLSPQQASSMILTNNIYSIFATNRTVLTNDKSKNQQKINISDSNEKHALHQAYILAAIEGNFPKLQSLIQNKGTKFDPLVKDDHQYKAILLAFLNNDVIAAKYLMKKLDYTFTTVDANRIVEQVIEKNADLTFNYFIKHHLIDPNAKLHSFNGSIWMSGNTKMQGYYTPLYLACRNGSTSIVKCLLSVEKIDVNLGANFTYDSPYAGCGDFDDYGTVIQSPIEIAVFQGHHKIIGLLVDYNPTLESTIQIMSNNKCTIS